MRKSERLILDSQSPDEYVSNSLKSRLSPAEKAKLARLWMERTGYTREDIIQARNRNAYWRMRKMQGAAERTKRRMETHDYSRGKNIEWTRERLAEFLTLNRKDAYGRYLRRDWELAAHFGTSIPSIQYLRRKYNKVKKMLGPSAKREKILDYMSCSELVLQHGGPKSRRRRT
jgi:hypothetical protein